MVAKVDFVKLVTVSLLLFSAANGYAQNELRNTFFKDADAAKAAGQWQCLDLIFRAARWEGETKTENARLSAHLNGQLIHDDVPIPDKTGSGRDESPEAGPLKLQDHGNAVAFRNIWMVPLEL